MSCSYRDPSTQLSVLCHIVVCDVKTPQNLGDHFRDCLPQLQRVVSVEVVWKVILSGHTPSLKVTMKVKVIHMERFEAFSNEGAISDVAE